VKLFRSTEGGDGVGRESYHTRGKVPGDVTRLLEAEGEDAETKEIRLASREDGKIRNGEERRPEPDSWLDGSKLRERKTFKTSTGW